MHGLRLAGAVSLPRTEVRRMEQDEESPRLNEFRLSSFSHRGGRRPTGQQQVCGGETVAQNGARG